MRVFYFLAGGFGGCVAAAILESDTSGGPQKGHMGVPILGSETRVRVVNYSVIPELCLKFAVITPAPGYD